MTVLVLSLLCASAASAVPVPLSDAVSTVIPTVSGDGIYLEMFLGVGGGTTPQPSHIEGRTRNADLLSPFVDFPRPGQTVTIGNNFQNFFANTVAAPDSVKALGASNFILRATALLKITRDLDRNTSTPAIDVQIGIGSDDGYYLKIGNQYLGGTGDRGFTYSWHSVEFEDEGMYPLYFLFAANSVGYSGLELSWRVAAGEAILPQSNLYTTTSDCASSINFEEYPAGTLVTDQYRGIGVVFTQTSGDVQITNAQPTKFVPVSGDRVFANPTPNPTEPGQVEISLVVPGTETPAVTDHFSCYVIDAESIGTTITAYDPQGNQIFANTWHTGGAAREMAQVDVPAIRRLVIDLGSGADTSALDNLCFGSIYTDTTRPETSLTQGPAQGAMVCSLPVQFAFSGTDDRTPSDAIRFRWRIDGGEWSADSTTAQVAFDALADGPHTFEVAAVDRYGNVDDTPVVRSFAVDTTAPVISSIGIEPAATTCVLTWATDGPATTQVEYMPASGEWTSTALDTNLVGSHSVILTGLQPVTEYSFRLKSKDSCDRESVTDVVVFSTLADTTPPDTAITLGPADGAALSTTSVEFAWTGSDDVTPTSELTYSYRIDGQDWSDFGAVLSTSFASLSEGQHAFEVKARDVAGNEDPTPASRTFRVDTQPPAVASAVPSNGSYEVALGMEPYVVFSEDMAPATINGSTFTVTGAPRTYDSEGGEPALQAWEGPVPGAVSYDAPNRMATFVPAEPLWPDTTYTMTITTGVTDLAGNALAEDYQWSFTTVSGPTITYTYPYNNDSGIQLHTSIYAEFGRRMDNSTITSSTFRVVDGEGNPVSGSFSYYNGSNWCGAEFYPSSQLAPGVTYTVTVTTGVKDTNGIPMANDYVWSFTTIGPPAVAWTDPDNGATGIRIMPQLSAGFDRYMDSSTVSDSTFILQDPDGNLVPGLVESQSGDGSSYATFTVLAGLQAYTTYTATITTGVTDSNGLALAENYSWGFTTGAPASVAWTDPAADAVDVRTTQPITAGFTDPVDAASLDTTTFVVTDPEGNLVPGAVFYDEYSWAATFVPAAGYRLNAVYTATITTGVRDAGGNYLENDYTWSFTTGGPPTVVANDPLNGASGVRTSSAISATFSDSMDPASINTNTFTLVDGFGTPATGVVNYDPESRKATFAPIPGLIASTTYTATITAGATDAGGNPLAGDYSWSFATAGPPTVVSTAPAGGASEVPVESTIIATFSEMMNPATINAATFTLVDAASSPVTGTVTYNSETQTAIFTPASRLAPGAQYTATMTTGATDVGGNALVGSYTWSFTTAEVLMVISTSPASGGTGASIRGKVSAVFNRAMSAGSITTSTFSLVDSGGAPVACSVAYAAATRTAALTPGSPLAHNETYTARITTGVVDSQGSALLDDYVWSFTTSVGPVVDSTDPARDDTTGPNSQIKATFSDPMDPSTINTDTFRVMDSGGNTLEGTVTYDSGTRTATFTPASPMVKYASYMATVTTGATGADGTPMDEDYVWGFGIGGLYDPDFTLGASVLNRNDDSYMGPFTLPFPVSIFDSTFTRLWVNNNGNVTFGSGDSSYSPSAFPYGVARVAGFYSDVDTRCTASGLVYYKVSPDQNQVVVTWDHVGQYSYNCNNLNTFQIVFSRDGLIIFSYEDMLWVRSTPPVAGFNQGDGVHSVMHFHSNNAADLKKIAWKNFYYTNSGGTPQQNQPPVANAGPDQSVLQDRPDGALIRLDGSASTDDGAIRPLTYTWLEGSTLLGTGEVLERVFSAGVHQVILTVFDGQFRTSDIVIITVVDTYPPDTTITSGPLAGSVVGPDVSFAWTGVDNLTPQSQLLYSFDLNGQSSAFGPETSYQFTGLVDGDYAFSVVAQDAAGLIDPTPAVRHFTVDATPPLIGGVSAAPGLTDCVITWATDEPATAQVVYGLTDAYGLETPVYGAFVMGHAVTLSGLADGATYHFKVLSADRAGNLSVSDDFTFTTIADTVAPTTHFTSGPAQGGTVCSLPVAFTWAASDNVTPAAQIEYRWRMDGGEWSEWSSATSQEFADLAEGSHTFEVSARDLRGNEEIPVGRTFTVDLTAPVVSDVSANPGATQATVTWTTDEPATSQVEYGLDTNYGSVTPLQGNLKTAHSVTISGLTTGTTYHFRVKSKDGCGRETVSGDLQFTTIDNIPPDTQILSGPVQGSYQSSTEATFTWTGTDNFSPAPALTYSVKLDSGAFGPFTFDTTVTYTDLAQGSHTFQVRAMDEAGNIDATPATRTFTVDTTPPAAPVVTDDGDFTNDPTRLRASWTANDPQSGIDSYSYSIRRVSDDFVVVDWLSVGASTSVTNDTLNLDEGEAYYFAVKATNRAGLESEEGRSNGITVDTIPPVISQLAVESVNYSTVRVIWSTDEPSTSRVEYGLTSAYGTLTPLDSRLVIGHIMNISGLALSNTYYYRVYSKDAAGNEAVSEGGTFNTPADLNPPDTQISSGPGSGAKVCEGTVTFGFTGSDDATHVSQLQYSWSLNGGAASPFSAVNTQTFNNLASGRHTLVVAARDLSGNVDPSPAIREFTVDLDAPVISDVQASPSRAQASITWTTDEPTTTQVEYGLTEDYGSMTPLNSQLVTSHSASPTGLNPSTTYHYRVRSKDSCGRETISLDGVFTTQADDGTPDTFISSGPSENEIVCSGSVNICWSGSDDATPTSQLKYSWKMDSSEWSAYGSDTCHQFTGLAAGGHTFLVRARDASGNVDPSPAMRKFNVDLSTPTISNVNHSVGSVEATITWSTNKVADSQVEYGPTAALGSVTPLNSSRVNNHTVVITGLTPDRGYHYRVKSKDACGREVVSATSGFNTTPDYDIPNTLIASGPPENGKACDTTVTFCWSGSDNATPVSELEYSYKMDNDAWSEWGAETCQDFTDLAEGLHTFMVKAKDGAGNVDASPAVRYFFVDLTTPTINAASVLAVPRQTSATISWITSEPTTTQVEYGTTEAYGTLSQYDAARVGSHRITITGLTPETTYHFRVKSSDGCTEVVSENGTFTTTAIVPPNLVPAGMVMPQSASAQQYLDVQWTVTNKGSGDAEGSWQDVLYLSKDEYLDDQDIPLGAFSRNQPLTSMFSYTRNETVRVPLVAPGLHYVIVKTDDAGVITETNELDNGLAQPLNITMLRQMLVAPDRLQIPLTPGVPVSGQVDISNLGTTGLTGITSSIRDKAESISIQLSAPADMDPLTARKINYTVMAIDESVLENLAVAEFVASDGSVGALTFDMRVRPRQPKLVASPAYLETGMLRGRRTLVEFEVTNTGAVPANNVQVLVPNTSWLSLVTPQNIGTMAPGEKIRISLALNPPADLPLVPYNGSIAVNATGAGVGVGFQFRAISDGKGGVRVLSRDEFSYFADDRPPVTNATVKVKDAVTGEIVSAGLTDETGTYLNEDLLEGHYTLEVSADKHGTHNGPLQIVAGETKEIEAFLPRQLVTYSWNVEPVQIEDRYRVNLEAVFETHVPAPVVTVDPPFKMVPILEGLTTSVDITVTNHGLIAAEGVKVDFEGNADYEVVPLIREIGRLPAMSSVVVPVKIRARKDGPITNLPQVATATAAAQAAMAREAEEAGNAVETDKSTIAETYVPPGQLCDALKGGVMYYYVCGPDTGYKWQARSVSFAPVFIAMAIWQLGLCSVAAVDCVIGTHIAGCAGLVACFISAACDAAGADTCFCAILGAVLGLATGGSLSGPDLYQLAQCLGCLDPPTPSSGTGGGSWGPWGGWGPGGGHVPYVAPVQINTAQPGLCGPPPVSPNALNAPAATSAVSTPSDIEKYGGKEVRSKIRCY